MTRLQSSRLSIGIGAVGVAAVCALSAPRANEKDLYEVVHAFDRGTEGDRPTAALITARDGNFYGTTERGGVYGNGAVYRLTPDGAETVLHSFAAAVDGTAPSALIEGRDGNFYGTAQAGTLSTFGTIFRVAPDGAFETVHQFTCGADGGYPSHGLVQATDGNFYGTTLGIGTPYCGAPARLFRMTPDGTLSTLYVFNSQRDGTEPVAPLIQARDGALYGTAQYGGPGNGGTVFRVTTEGTFTLLHAFHYPNDEEGREPRAALLEAADGTFYGTTTYGGACSACGTIFRVTPDGVFLMLYTFTNGSEAGTEPLGSLIQGLDGNFYGTTFLLDGAIFQMTEKGELTVLHAFTGGWDGRNPEAALLQTADGVFYGTAANGGPAGTGTVYRVTADGVFEVVYTFPGSDEGASPSALVDGADGSVYGTARAGGPFNKGTVFQLTADGMPLPLHAFDDLRGEGSAPSTLIRSREGTLYGLTEDGGAQRGGTFFQLTPAGDFTVIEAFTTAPTATAIPSTGLLQAHDGSIYGAASRGGAYGWGALFRWTTDGTFVMLHSFSGGVEGMLPVTLIQARDGTFYGTTLRGGAYNAGTIFRMAPDGTVTTLYDRDSGGVSHGFIEADDGNLYVTSGSKVLRVMPDGMVSVLYTFQESSPPKGLVQASDGQLYGTTSFGDGTVFRLTLDGTVTTLHMFSYPDAWDVLGVPIQGRDGSLYGTTWSGGGPGKQGIVFRLALR